MSRGCDAAAMIEGAIIMNFVMDVWILMGILDIDHYIFNKASVGPATPNAEDAGARLENLQGVITPARGADAAHGADVLLTPCHNAKLRLDTIHGSSFSENAEVLDQRERLTDAWEALEGDGVENQEESDDSDEDIETGLEPGEIKRRLYLKSLPDSTGFYEANPDDVSLCPLEKKERRYRMRRGITADSGAGDSVIPKRMVNKKKIKSSAGQRRGLHYVSATNHRIPNEGEIEVELETNEGHHLTIPFQVADVNKPLMSISDRVDSRCRVTFDQDDNTGEDLTNIYDKATKKMIKLRRVGKVWVLDCTVNKEFVSEDNSVFNRPGR